MERVRVHLAWRRDKGEPLTPDQIRKHMPDDGRVCDLGCGDGMLMRGLVGPGVTIFGVEPDATARQAAQPGMTILEGSAESLPGSLERASFDVVVMSHVLEHCADPSAAVENVRSLLKPGGVAIISVPNNECEGLRQSGPSWRWLDVPRHLNFFTGRSLAALCKRVGLDSQVVGYDGYCRQFTDEWAEEEARISREFSLPAPPSRWKLLGRTMFSRPEHKYDSVRMIARKPVG
jgi:SAM-dependent methyltransferase